MGYAEMKKRRANNRVFSYLIPSSCSMKELYFIREPFFIPDTLITLKNAIHPLKISFEFL